MVSFHLVAVFSTSYELKLASLLFNEWALLFMTFLPDMFKKLMKFYKYQGFNPSPKYSAIIQFCANHTQHTVNTKRLSTS